MNKGPIILGIGAALAAVGLFLKGKPAKAAPPGEVPEGEIPEANTVEVYLKNPPADATTWWLALVDRDVNQMQEATALHEVSGKDQLEIDEVAVFQIPSGTRFPLYIMALQIAKWNIDKTALTMLYEIQSYRPYKYDFDTRAYTGGPDPSYRNITIPDYGVFYLEA